MKAKTSITLSKDVLAAVDRLSRQYKNRSEFIELELAVRAFIAQMARSEQNTRDLEIINRRADQLNQEAMDVLDYQASL